MDPALAEGHVGIIIADQPCPLRDEQDAAGDAVIDRLGHLRGNLPRKIGANPGDEGSRNDAARLQDMGARRWLDPTRRYRPALGGAVCKGGTLSLCCKLRHRRPTAGIGNC